MADVLFTNVRVFDGGGEAPFTGEVLVQGNRISRVTRSGFGARSVPEGCLLRTTCPSGWSWRRSSAPTRSSTLTRSTTWFARQIEVGFIATLYLADDPGATVPTVPLDAIVKLPTKPSEYGVVVLVREGDQDVPRSPPVTARRTLANVGGVHRRISTSAPRGLRVLMRPSCGRRFSTTSIRPGSLMRAVMALSTAMGIW